MRNRSKAITDNALLSAGQIKGGNGARLDPISLQLFISAIKEGTIAGTAEREHIAAAAVSRRLSELEVTLQTKLFSRSNKGVEPTAAGEALLHLARRVLHDMDDIHEQMREFSGGTRGYVKVFANISSITQFLPRELEAFLKDHPNVQISLEERISSEIIAAVSESTADVGLFALGPPTKGLKVFPYRRDELILLVSKDHVLARKTSASLKDLLDFEFVGLHPGSWINFQLMKAATELGRTVKLRMQVTGYDALSLMVEAGLGIGILPKNTAKPYVSSLAVKAITLKEPWVHREFGICVRSYEDLSVAAKLLVDHLRASSLETEKLSK